MRIKYDQFNKGNWYYHSSSPNYINYNGVYLYFLKPITGNATNLRLVIQYAAEDWIFWNYCIFNINNKAITYTPNKVDRDSETTIWEWSDENIEDNKELLSAIENANNASIRFVGQYTKDKDITEETLAMRKVLELYKEFGGQI